MMLLQNAPFLKLPHSQISWPYSNQCMHWVKFYVIIVDVTYSCTSIHAVYAHTAHSYLTDATLLVILQAVLAPKLSMAQVCNYQMRDCICDISQKMCNFNLLIEAMPPFTSYELNILPAIPGMTGVYRGALLYFDSTGSLAPSNITYQVMVGALVLQMENLHAPGCKWLNPWS